MMAYSASMNIHRIDSASASSPQPQEHGQTKGDLLMRRIHVKSISVATIIATIVLGATCAATLVAE